ncbi:pentapeptide repeat-containing protein [Streptomyces sp. NPDC093225]|uniref:pentapeptide repeat-containing protein n=1 Tax=Streptomyces sp. NPDC093225 TaxID=3366034 RepID=UPI003818E340
MVVLVLGPLSWLVAGETVGVLRGKERAEALNAVRQTVLAALGGASVLAGLVFTARTYRLSRRGQVTERFRAAVGHLASDRLTERLGAVYSLEHVLAESAEEHNTVVGVLAAFIRENTRRDGLPDPAAPPTESGMREPVPPWGAEPPADIRAAVEVLARRPDRPEPGRIDLRSITLSGLNLRSFDFATPPRLTRMYLTWADLRRADLRGADLSRSILNGAELCFAQLHRARLQDVGLIRADLRGAALGRTVLLGADLSGADLRDTEHLTPAQLAGAELDDETRLPAELAAHPWVAARLADCRAWRSARPAASPWHPTPPTPEPGGAGAGVDAVADAAPEGPERSGGAVPGVAGGVT